MPSVSPRCVWLMVVGLFAACSLNPQPDLPADRGGQDSGGTAAGGKGVGVVDPSGPGAAGAEDEPSPDGGAATSGGGAAPGPVGGSPGEGGGGPVEGGQAGQTQEGGAPTQGGQAGESALSSGGHD